MTKRLAFIAWDGPYVTYLEGLFAPIFAGLAKTHGYEFHILHFTWHIQRERREMLQLYCIQNSIRYTHFEISLLPTPSIGKFITLFKGIVQIRKYLRTEKIDVVIPRSTMPALMTLFTLRLGAKRKLLFDADGLPIEERVDFAGLQKGGAKYNRLKRTEGEIIRRSDAVITRTVIAAKLLSEQHHVALSKFFQVVNGRDPDIFKPNNVARARIRKEWRVESNSLILIYCGSVGPQYGFNQMLTLHQHLNNRVPSWLVLLVNNPSFTVEELDDDIRSRIIIRRVPVNEIPLYLSSADIGLAIRRNSLSMKGVAPIKIPEYLLCGLPVIASSGIGDSDNVLGERSFSFLMKSYENPAYEDAVDWILEAGRNHELKREARQFAKDHYSVDMSVESYNNALTYLI